MRIVVEIPMDLRLQALHREAGRICGRERTCGSKRPFETEEEAERAAAAHNRWEKRQHDVESYPCFFCDKWHIGNVMPEEVLRAIIAEADLSDPAK